MYAFTGTAPIPQLSHSHSSSFLQRGSSHYIQQHALRPAFKARVLRAPTRWRCQLEPLLLTESSVNQALEEARSVLGTLFDESAGITGKVHLASLDGPIVVLRLEGRFWHKRSDVVSWFP